MCNDQDSAILCHPVQSLLHQRLALCIQRAGGLHAIAEADLWLNIPLVDQGAKTISKSALQ